MKKPFIVANVREVLDLYDKEEISFSRMVEMLNEIAEKHYQNKPVSDEKVDEFVTDMMKKDPIKFVQYCLVVIGRFVHESNSKQFSFSSECNVTVEKRVKVTLTGTINEL